MIWPSSIVLSYGPLLGLMAVESAGVPVPGETSVTIASLLASASIGRLAYTIGRLGTTGVVINAAVLGIGTFAAHDHPRGD